MPQTFKTILPDILDNLQQFADVYWNHVSNIITHARVAYFCNLRYLSAVNYNCRLF